MADIQFSILQESLFTNRGSVVEMFTDLTVLDGEYESYRYNKYQCGGVEGGRSASVLINTEVEILSVMYEGDKNRDASDKIRGFLFQDYVTIMCLLQNQVKYVCSEYLEDVDVFFEDGTFEFIQVKYYPKTSPSMEKISTDLYYQYLRLQMLRSTLKAKPSLYIHRNSKVEKPTLDEMKVYIGLGNALPKSVTYPNTADSVTCLRANVYSTNKKHSGDMSRTSRNRFRYVLQSKFQFK